MVPLQCQTFRTLGRFTGFVSARKLTSFYFVCNYRYDLHVFEHDRIGGVSRYGRASRETYMLVHNYIGQAVFMGDCSPLKEAGEDTVEVLLDSVAVEVLTVGIVIFHAASKYLCIVPKVHNPIYQAIVSSS